MWRRAFVMVPVLVMAALVACSSNEPLAQDEHLTSPAPSNPTTSAATNESKSPPVPSPINDQEVEACAAIADAHANFLSSSGYSELETLVKTLGDAHRDLDFFNEVGSGARITNEQISEYNAGGADADTDSYGEAIRSLSVTCMGYGVTFPPGNAQEALESGAKRVFRSSEDLVLVCGEENEPVRSFEEAWDAYSLADREKCINISVALESEPDFDFHDFELTDLEEESMEKAGYQEALSIPLLHVQCAQSYEESSFTDWGAHHAEEKLGVLHLCPDHPNKYALEAAIEGFVPWLEAQESGDIYPAGTLRVPDGIAPGTYVAESSRGFEGCYWERLDASGNILSNNFMTSGFRAEVTIYPGDHSFHSERCGQWLRLY